MSDSAKTVAVPSPCNAVCRIDAASGWCLGCGRTLDEIAAWSRWSDEDKRRVWLLLPSRRALLPAIDPATAVRPPRANPSSYPDPDA